MAQMPDIAPKRKAASPSALDPAVLLQTAQADYNKVQEQQMRDAHAFALGQQTAMQTAQQQYQQAAQAPSPNPIPQQAALPYFANAFAAGFSGNDQLRQSADQAVHMNAAQLRERRAQNLGALHEQYLNAAQQANQAGDFEREIKYRQQAEKSHEALVLAQRGVERQQEQDFQLKRDRLAELHQERDRAIQMAMTIWQTQAESPILRARVQALGGAYESQTKAISDQLALLATRTDAKSTQVRDGLTKRLAALTDQFKSQLKELQAEIPAPPDVFAGGFKNPLSGGVGSAATVPPGSGPSPASPVSTPSTGFQNPWRAGAPPAAATGPSGAPVVAAAAPASPAPTSVSMAGYEVPKVYAGLAETLNMPTDQLRVYMDAQSTTVPGKTNKQVLIDHGYDPRELERAQIAREAAAKQAGEAKSTAAYWEAQGPKYAAARAKAGAERAAAIRQELAVLRPGTIDDMRISALREELASLGGPGPAAKASPAPPAKKASPARVGGQGTQGLVNRFMRVVDRLGIRPAGAAGLPTGAPDNMLSAHGKEPANYPYPAFAEMLGMDAAALASFLSTKSASDASKTNAEVLRAAGFDPAELLQAQKVREVENTGPAWALTPGAFPR